MKKSHLIPAALASSALAVSVLQMCPALPVAAAPNRDISQRAGITEDRVQIVHVLNRLEFGPRPGDVETMGETGIIRWIDGQLNPQTIDDSAVENKLSSLATQRFTLAQLMNAYTADQAFGKQKRAEKERQEKANATPASTTAAPAMIDMAADAPVPDGLRPQDKARPRQAVSARKTDAMAEAMRDGIERGISIQAVGEMQVAKLVRAVESKRQLQEVLADFWTNHFNLDVKKGPVRTLRVADERDAIRPHVLGNFRDMLEASAKSPAMLFYLDNARSSRPVPIRNNRNRRNKGVVQANAEPGDQPKTRGGVNENYARELMELHTLGVDGGYTQQDVQEVARCFTGWSFNRESGAFQFRPFLHDNGSKVVLGHTIRAGGGINDGEAVLDIVAMHPATAHHLAYQLCQRFIADEPPAALVERAAKAYLQSNGDLKILTRTIITSPEFFAAANTANKIKSPFEFAVSSVRALGGTIFVPDSAFTRGRLMLIADGNSSTGKGGGAGGNQRMKTLPREIAAMGQPMYACQPPTGYAEDSRGWVSTGTLVERLNFALALSNGSFADVTAPPLRVKDSNDPAEAVRILSLQLLGQGLSPATEATIQKQFTPNTPVDLKKLCALIIGSPEFQRR